VRVSHGQRQVQRAAPRRPTGDHEGARPGHDTRDDTRAHARAPVTRGDAGREGTRRHLDHADPPALIAVLIVEISRTQVRRSLCSRFMMASGVQWK
jgi:hypothetical protein